MLLSEIDFTRLVDVADPDRWGVSTHMDRRIFRDEGCYYKLWGERFIAATHAAVGRAFTPIPGLIGIHGFEVGLYKPEICSAFLDLIYDDHGRVRGYVTQRGDHPPSVPDEFSDRVFKLGIECGWLFSDLKEGNVVMIGGVCSLIDYDTHLTSVKHFDAEFEREHGCLRPHVAPRYRELIMNSLCWPPSVDR